MRVAHVGRHAPPAPHSAVIPDGSIRVVRSNVYNKIGPFVAFTKLIEDKIKGTHDTTRPRPLPKAPGCEGFNRLFC